MTQEEKQLLLIDLAARLPYKVRIKLGEYCDYTLKGINGNVVKVSVFEKDLEHDIDITNLGFILPYLRPMSSMTKQEKELACLAIDYYGNIDFNGDIDVRDHEIMFVEDMIAYIDFLNSRHFDHRNLISRGLALEAPKDMYNDK